MACANGGYLPAVRVAATPTAPVKHLAIAVHLQSIPVCLAACQQTHDGSGNLSLAPALLPGAATCTPDHMRGDLR